MTQIVCSLCGVLRDISEYARRGKDSDKLRKDCNVCKAAKAAVWRENNPEKMSEIGKRRQMKLKTDEVQKQHRLEYNRKYMLSRSKTINYRLTMYRSGAKERNLSFDLTIEEFSSLWQAPCFYCNDKIETIGIDRIDNAIGYCITNIVSCCTFCNFIKGDMNINDFKSKISKIYNLNKVST